jgi:hypothetical protein
MCPDVSEEYQQKQQEDGEEHEGKNVHILAAIDDPRPQKQKSQTAQQENPGDNSGCPELEDSGSCLRNHGRYAIPKVLQHCPVKLFSPAILVSAV